MGIKATAGIRTGGIKAGTSTRNVEILPMPHITIGDVETLPAGSSATATMTGTIDYPVLNLGIPQGETGETGATGAKGDQGETGPQGAKGDTGAKGDKGDKGDTGATGPAGTAATITIGTVSSGETPAVTNSGTSQDAVFNFTFPKGDKGDTGSQGPQGETGPAGSKGDKGDKGDTGTAATIAVGTVTGGATASVTNSGTSSAAVLDFVLPKGDKGDTGNAGAAATISVGNVSSGSTASVTNSGTSSAAVFDFVLPKGDTGSAGSAATIAVGTVTSGSTASVTNSGTSSAAVFDFVLPKGDKGDTGTGIPSGGSDGQLVGKSSGAITWVDAPSGIFYATYGTTTYNDVSAAYTAGKAIFVKNGEVVVPMTNVSSNMFQFKYLITSGSGKIGWYNLTSGGWYSSSGTEFVLQTRTINSKALSANITLTASDVGALPDSTTIPTNVSDLNNDSGYLTLSTLPIYDGSVT